MNEPRLVNIWTLKMGLDRMVTDADLAELELKVRDVMDQEAMSRIVAAPIIWQRRGANLTVHTQGHPAPLIEIAQWALDNMAPLGPKEFTVGRMQSAPLRLKEGWRGYDGN